MSPQSRGVSAPLTEAAALPSTAPHLRTIFDEQFTYVWNSLRRLGVREADLEDLAQDVFVQVQRSISTYEPSRAIRPWLFGFARHLASDYRRSARYRTEVLHAEVQAVDPSAAADELVTKGENRALLLEALGALDDDRRDVFILHEIDEVTVPDLADALHIPLNTAYSRLRLAREDFARAIQRLLLRRGTP